MKPTDLLRRLRRRANRLGIPHTERPGKGGHVLVRHGSLTTTVAMHREHMPTGSFRGVLKQLHLRPEDLED